MNTNKVECQTWNTNQMRNLQMSQTPALATPKSQVLRCCPHSLLSGCSGGFDVRPPRWAVSAPLGVGRPFPSHPLAAPCVLAVHSCFSAAVVGRPGGALRERQAHHHRSSTRDCSYPWKKRILLDTFSTPSVNVLRHGSGSLGGTIYSNALLQLWVWYCHVLTLSHTTEGLHQHC